MRMSGASGVSLERIITFNTIMIKSMTSFLKNMRAVIINASIYFLGWYDCCEHLKKFHVICFVSLKF